MWLFPLLIGQAKSILGLVLGSELGRLVLAVAVAYFVGHYRATTHEREVCRAAVAASEQAAKTIDLRAAEAAREAAERQRAMAEARAKAREAEIKELANEVQTVCPLDDRSINLLGRLRRYGPAGSSP
jgi:guanyl-specific ribonuclease Sa